MVGRRSAVKSITVKDLMIPLEEYATVSDEATLHEAVLALEEAQKSFEQSRYTHRAILVFDKANRIVGKLSQLDVIRSLEPKYEQILDDRATSRFGFSPAFIKSMLDKFSLWQRPLDDLCRKAARMKVKDIMYAPTSGEYVDENASLDKAIHQLVMGHHQSLLVTRGEAIVGILRLSDVFKEVCDRIKVCEL
jgi:CBS domain-containing protein